MPVLLLILSCCYFSCLKVYCIVKYSGQKRLFLPHAPNFKTFISSLFFYFRKICSRHHCHHFHLRFCWVLLIGWGEMIFCQKFGKRGVKHETFLMWNRVKSFWGKPSDFCLVNFLGGQSLFLLFLKKQAAYFFPPPSGGGILGQNIYRCVHVKIHSWISLLHLHKSSVF